MVHVISLRLEKRAKRVPETGFERLASFYFLLNGLRTLLFRVFLGFFVVEFEELGCYFLEEKYSCYSCCQKIEREGDDRSKTTCISECIYDIIDSSGGSLILIVSIKQSGEEVTSESAIVHVLRIHCYVADVLVLEAGRHRTILQDSDLGAKAEIHGFLFVIEAEVIGYEVILNRLLKITDVQILLKMHEH